LTKPISAASSANTTRLENKRSAARAGPMSRDRIHVTPCSAGRPRRAKLVVSLAPAEANRMSVKHIITKPTPAAGPLTAAITGFVNPRRNVWRCS
jgi:hypothetical protein